MLDDRDGALRADIIREGKMDHEEEIMEWLYEQLDDLLHQLRERLEDKDYNRACRLLIEAARSG